MNGFIHIMMKGGFDMLKGKELLDYTINQIDYRDKFTAIYTLADELVGLGDDIARRAISLLNPLTQYSFLESIILEDKDSDTKLVDYIKSKDYPLPIMYGWKHIRVDDKDEQVIDESQWYEDKHKCYCQMFNDAMRLIENAVDCCSGDEIKILPEGLESITIECCKVRDVYEMLEM